MLHLSAAWRGECVVLTPFRGTVHSVFDSACNVADATGLRLVMVLTTSHNLPQGITLRPPANFRFSQFVHPGQPVGLRGGVLRVGGALAVDVRQAQVWRAGVHELAVDLTQSAQWQAWQVAWRTTGDALAALPETDRAWCRALLSCAGDGAATRPWGAIPASMIGCGPGLTPAGDDFVVGYLIGLWSNGSVSGVDANGVRELGEQVLQGAAQTNEISQHYLRHAAAGYAAEPLRTVACAIAAGDCPHVVQKATAAACAVGASSGVAGVLGLLCALRAVLQPT